MKKLKDISTNIKVFILFIIILLATSILTNYIPYSNWWNLIEDTSVKTADNLNEEIIGEIDEFIRESKQLNLMHKSLLEKNLIDIGNQVERESFFVNSLSNFKNENIYSFSYGSKSGDYYGARRNENNQVEIMRNNEESLGHSMYYSAKNGRAEDLVLDAGKFDPRTRD